MLEECKYAVKNAINEELVSDKFDNESDDNSDKSDESDEKNYVD